MLGTRNHWVTHPCCRITGANVVRVYLAAERRRLSLELASGAAIAPRRAWWWKIRALRTLFTLKREQT